VGAHAPGWAPHEAALLRAADELRASAGIGDATWQVLAARYSNDQLMDVVFTVGQYTMVSMALNTFRTPPDAGLAGF
jgi:alkylhydroperoxidase family enzyme